MLPVLEHAPKVRFPRLTTYFGLITSLFCAGLAFRCERNFAVSGFYETQPTPLLSVKCCRVSTVTRYSLEGKAAQLRPGAGLRLPPAPCGPLRSRRSALRGKD